MADDLINESADALEAENKLSESNKRIQQLSEKVRLTAEERDEKAKVLQERDLKIAELEKENAFNSSFSDILGSQPSAKDHKDEIKAKVMVGYTPEDAAYAVLGKAGLLGGAVAPTPKSPAGGSAATTIPQGGNKAIKDMNRDELRGALLAAEQSGDIAST